MRAGDLDTRPSENRIKELKLELKADRLSCHRFLANQFRLLLHTAAYCLFWLLRHHLQGTELAAAQVNTLRLKLLKIGARIRETSRRINPINQEIFRQKAWAPMLKRLGLRYRPPYQMRHTFATLALSLGENPNWVSRMLGHKSLVMTLERYNRYVPNLAREDGKLLAGTRDMGKRFPMSEKNNMKYQ